MIPIAISAKVPDWYKGLRYSKLAPTYDILMKYKEYQDEPGYIECFNNMVLKQLNPIMVASELEAWLNLFYDIKLYLTPLHESTTYHVALICYEAPDKFCHRHLVAEWFENYGIDCGEWEEMYR